MVQKSIYMEHVFVAFSSKNLCVGMADNAWTFNFSF